MQQYNLPEPEDFNKMYKLLEEIKALLQNQTIQPIKKSKAENELDEIKLYIPLHKAWDEMGITKDQWYKNYKKVIQWKKYRGSVWVYAPSIKKFFQDKNVNKV